VETLAREAGEFNRKEFLEALLRGSLLLMPGVGARHAVPVAGGDKIDQI